MLSRSLVPGCSEVLGQIPAPPRSAQTSTANFEQEPAAETTSEPVPTIGTAVGGGAGDGGPAVDASLESVVWVAVAPSGDVYVGDRANAHNRVRRIDNNGDIHAAVGTGAWELLGDGDPAIDAALATPAGIDFDAAGNLYIADPFNLRVRKVDTSGTITTIAGSGDCPCPFASQSGFSGDGGPATEAVLDLPDALTADSAGNVYVVDQDNHRVRKIDTAGIITTVAGNGDSGCSMDADYNYSCRFTGEGGRATETALPTASGLAADDDGNLYISSTWTHRVLKVDPQGVIRTVVGTGEKGFSGDGGPATDAMLNYPGDLELDAAGNLYLTDRANNRIRKVDADGIITTVAGDGTGGACGMAYFCSEPAGDGGAATSASLSIPNGISLDAAGNLYIADVGHRRVRKVSVGGIITTIAGNGYNSYAGEGLPASSGGLRKPQDVAFDRAGNMFIADTGNHVIRRVDATSGIIETVAGRVSRQSSGGGFSGDGGPATQAALKEPVAVAVDDTGSLYIADFGNARVRKVDPNGIITTYAGTGQRPANGLDPCKDRVSATSICLVPADIAVDEIGNLFIGDYVLSKVHKVDAAVSADGTHHVSTYAGTGLDQCPYPCNRGDGGPATTAILSARGVTLDPDSNLYIGDQSGNRVRHVEGSASDLGIHRISTVAGNGEWKTSGNGGPATSASLKWPVGVAVDGKGNIYIQQRASEGISGGYFTRKVDSSGTISSIAGRCGYGLFFLSGDGGPAIDACLDSPGGIALDANEDLHLADSNNGRIRRIDFTQDPAASPSPSPTPSGPAPAPTSTSTSTPSPNAGTYPEIPSDPYFGPGESLDPLGAMRFGTQWGLQKIQANKAWQEQRATGLGVNVAVIDSGLAVTHEDLACPGKIRIISGSDVVANDGIPDDENGHGTHVAGIIGACTNNGKGIAGVAPDATIMPVRVLNASGSGTSGQLAAGIDRAIKAGAHIINLSLGFGESSGSDLFNFSEIDTQIEAAASAGVVVVVAAGNSSFPLCEYPALAEDVICVGATDIRDQRSWYSTFANKMARGGPAVVAPGGSGQIFCDAHSENILSLVPKGLDGCDEGLTGYDGLDGTSMAAPHVAATAALVYERLGGERSAGNAQKVIGALTSTGVDLGVPGYDPIYGSGRIDALAAVCVVGPPCTEGGPDPTESPSPSSTASPSESPSPTSSPSPSPSPAADPSATAFTENSAVVGQYSDHAPVEVRLTDDDGNPIEGAEIVFELIREDGTQSWTMTDTTDSTGEAGAQMALIDRPGTYTLTARYAGDPGSYQPSEAAMPFDVLKEDTVMTMKVQGKGSNRELTGTLTDLDSGAGIGDRTIDFYGDGQHLGSAQSDDSGKASLMAPPRYRGGNHEFETRFEGDDYYISSSSSDARSGSASHSAGTTARHRVDGRSSGTVRDCYLCYFISIVSSSWETSPTGPYPEQGAQNEAAMQRLRL